MSNTDKQVITDEGKGNVPAVPADESKVLAEFREHVNTLTIEDPEEMQARILSNLLKAKTADDVLRAGEAIPATEILDIPLTIESLRASESTFEDGADFYLHADATLLGNGDRVTFSCGARDVILKLVRLDQLGMLPCDAILQKADHPTKDGFYPIFLRPLDKDRKPF